MFFVNLTAGDKVPLLKPLSWPPPLIIAFNFLLLKKFYQNLNNEKIFLRYNLTLGFLQT